MQRGCMGRDSIGNEAPKFGSFAGRRRIGEDQPNRRDKKGHKKRHQNVPLCTLVGFT
jgi:hypothetical protein